MISKRAILSIFVCVFFTLTVVGIFHAIHSVFSARDSRGYDYNPVRSRGYDWTGPQKGEIVNLNYLKNEKMESLSEKSTRKLILLSVVDPECGACQMSADQMEYLQQSIQSKDCYYAVVSFSQKLSNHDLTEYLEKRNIFADSFIWTDGADQILPSINKMVLPTHILVDRSGNVLKTFPGTDKEKSGRERMVNQILKEISATTNKPNSN